MQSVLTIDDAEKSDQVPLMDSIYRQASRVLIHLGEAADESDDAMDSMAGRRITGGSALQPSKCVPWACFTTWWARNAPYFAASLEPPPTLSYDTVIIKRSSLLQQLHETLTQPGYRPSG